MVLLILLSSININNYKLQQYNYTWNHIFSSIDVNNGEYVILARNCDKSSFESFWNVTLGTDVHFINSENSCPQINGDETFALHDDGGNSIDTTYFGLLEDKCYKREATDSDIWNEVSGDVGTPDPGSGVTGGNNAGFVITEVSDAVGSGSYIYEFVELYYDGASGNTPPVIESVSRNPQNPSFEDAVCVSAIITDDSQVQNSWVEYSVNSGSIVSEPYDSTDASTHFYHIPPEDINDTVNYYIYAVDDSGAADTSNYYSYVVRDTAVYQDSINFRVLTYNGLNFSDNDGDRAGYFETVFDSSSPDIILMQEMIDAGGCDTILNRLNSGGDEFARADFYDGYDTDNMLFYRSSVCSLISQDTIKTDLRDIAEYVVKIGENELRFYSCHLKASEGSSNEQQRLDECTTLRDYLNSSIPQGSEFIIVGDMNFYGDEPGYYKLINSETNNNGRAWDPLESPYDWHENSTYADIHTQSPRTTQFGGGATGGLDDRFDFLFTNYGINDGSGIEYKENSYRAYGNDGNHYDMAVNDGTNDSVSSTVANALNLGSDHLPVYADFVSVTSNYNPGQPILSRIFDNAIVNPWPQPYEVTLSFKSTDAENDDLEYEIQWSTDPSFDSTGTELTSIYSSGDIVTTSIDLSPADPETLYFWRVRARDPDGSARWSQWSQRRSFTADMDLGSSPPYWYQVKSEQFDLCNFSNTRVFQNSVVLSEGQNQGSVISPPVVYSDLKDEDASRSNWIGMKWKKGEASDSIGVQLEYRSGGTWDFVPESDLPGNPDQFFGDGSDFVTVDLSSLDVSTYDTLRLKAVLIRGNSRASSNPSLQMWAIGQEGGITGDEEDDKFLTHSLSCRNIRLSSFTFTFSIPQREKVELKIYNITGRLVKILTDREYSKGTYKITWRGRNRIGKELAQGIYFLNFKAGEFSKREKLILLK